MNSVNIYIGDNVVIFSPKKTEELKKKASKNCIYLKSSDKAINHVVSSVKKNTLTISFELEGNPETGFKKFRTHFKIIEAAGGLIMNSKKQLLFIYRNKKWDLPKGKIERSETPRTAAVRECEEECAVTGLSVVKKLAPTYHMYELKGKWILKKTHWFLMKSSHKEKLIPQKEEGITKVEWIGSDGLKKVKNNTYPSVMNVLRSKND